MDRAVAPVGRRCSSQVLGTNEPEELQASIQYQDFPYSIDIQRAEPQRAEGGCSELSVCLPLLLYFPFFFFFSARLDVCSLCLFAIARIGGFGGVHV